MWPSAAPLALVAAVSTFVMLANLGGPRLWDRDEPRNAGCAREMMLRGDWIVPVFNGELRGHKPVLLYWCMMAAYHALGVSEFSARLPSALCAIGTVLCTCVIGRRLFGRAAGVWAGVALCSSLLFVMVGRAATPDSLLIFCTTLAMTIYVCGVFQRSGGTTDDAPPAVSASVFPERQGTVIAMYAAMSLAALAKGPVGVLLPCAVIGQFLLIVRLPDESHASRAGTFRRALRVFGPKHFLETLWLMRPITLLATVAVVAVPWYWAAGAATGGEFLREFLLTHNLGRAASAMEGHRGNVFFYPLSVLVGWFPWSVFAVPLTLDLGRRLRGEPWHPGIVLALCWIGVYVVLFSLARTKLPTYIAPCFPALALLTGQFVNRWSRQSSTVPWLRTAFGCYALIGAVTAVVVPIIAHRLLHSDEWLGLFGCVPLLAGLICLKLVAAHQMRHAATLFAGSSVAFCTLIFAVATQRIDGYQQFHILLQSIRARSSDPHIASYQILEPSWVFYGGRPITELPQSTPRPIAAGASGSVEPVEQVVGFLRSGPNRFVITRREHVRELESRLPPDVVILAEADRFLSSEKLVVLGRFRQEDHARVSAATSEQRR